MNLFIDRHQQLILNMLEAHVDFIIIGGYSVIYHGYKRTTGDMDIWLKPDNANKPKIISALEKCEIDKDSLKAIDELDLTGYVVFSMWEEPEKVDFITKINQVKYEEADKEKVFAETEGMKVPFLHLNHLILSKINTGRGKDKADIEELQKIERMRKKE
jgi:predicted nucleotidyltransferase